MDSQLRDHLQRLGLAQYVTVLQENGYKSWTQLGTIREGDLDHLGFKLGHRRRLQRQIATMNGYPQSKALLPEEMKTTRCTRTRGQGSQRGTAESPKRPRWTAGTTQRRTCCATCAAGCATISRTGGGLWWSTMPTMRASSHKVESHAPELLSHFLPQSPNCSILITSRSRDVAYKLTGSSAGIVEIRLMDKHSALVLFRNKLGFVADKDEAVELAHTLDSNPLVLT